MCVCNLFVEGVKAYAKRLTIDFCSIFVEFFAMNAFLDLTNVESSFDRYNNLSSSIFLVEGKVFYKYIYIYIYRYNTFIYCCLVNFI